MIIKKLFYAVAESKLTYVVFLLLNIGFGIKELIDGSIAGNLAVAAFMLIA